MEAAHTCRYCDTIVLDLTAAETYFTSIETSIDFDTDFVVSAIQNECVFFQWAAAVNAENVAKEDTTKFLRSHIANLPGVLFNGEDRDEEDVCSSDTGEDDTTSANGEENLQVLKKCISPKELDGTQGEEVPTRLRLSLESSSIGPKRCVVTRDLGRADVPRSRYSVHWDGPEMQLTVPGGM